MSTVVAKNLAVQNSVGTASVDLTTTDGSTLLAGGVGVMKMMQLTPKTTNGAAFYDFIGIPSWAKRITIMLNQISTNGTNIPQIQIGSGSITTNGYLSSAIGGIAANSLSGAVYSSGFVMLGTAAVATSKYQGRLTIDLLSGSTYTAQGRLSVTSGSFTCYTVDGTVTLSGALDRIRITTVNGTDLFDAGSVSVLVEGY